MSVLKTIDPDALALITSLVAIDLARGLDIEEQNIFGNFIVAVGSIVLTNAALVQAQSDAKAKKTSSQQGAAQEPGGPSAGPAAKEQQDQVLIREYEELKKQMAELYRLLESPGR
ncbi:MAG TPA: hypothetical protein PKA10_09780 [Selenomonadales bacterium]|nr:hypothetical protein [Selenomonadales bacterium]